MCDEKFLVIGTGFIGEYMGRGIRKIVGEDDLAVCVRGVKGHPEGREKREKALGYPVSVNDSGRALAALEPTVVILCPTPRRGVQTAKEALAPYCEERRRKGGALPDIYSFIPSPSAAEFEKIIFPGTNVVKILPNIMESVRGWDMRPVGINYITYSRPWPRDRKEVLKKFLSPYGYTARVGERDSLVLLTGKITSHVCYEVTFSMRRALEDAGAPVPLSRIGEGIRRAIYENYPDCPFVGGPLSHDLPVYLDSFLAGFVKAWFCGLHGFVLSHKEEVSEEDALRIDLCSLVLNTFPLCCESAEELMRDTANAATKGGILERGIEKYFEIFDGELKSRVRQIAEGDPISPGFYGRCEEAAGQISLRAYERSLHLS